ncbi:MAG TPA: c-type cytochrome [Stellaceae bacterium]
MVAIRGAALGAVLALATIGANSGHAADDQIARGQYLVAIMGCGDCHTAGSLLGKPDLAHRLGGSDVGFEVPGLGVFVGRNLTPDKETGLGNWSADQIITAFTTGKRPDGRILSPAMPWENFGVLTSADRQAIAAYLKSLPPVHHAIPGPFGVGEKATVLVEKIVPGDGMAPPPGK